MTHEPTIILPCSIDDATIMGSDEQRLSDYTNEPISVSKNQTGSNSLALDMIRRVRLIDLSKKDQQDLERHYSQTPGYFPAFCLLTAIHNLAKKLGTYDGEIPIYSISFGEPSELNLRETVITKIKDELFQVISLSKVCFRNEHGTEINIPGTIRLIYRMDKERKEGFFMHRIELYGDETGLLKELFINNKKPNITQAQLDAVTGNSHTPLPSAEINHPYAQAYQQELHFNKTVERLITICRDYRYHLTNAIFDELNNHPNFDGDDFLYYANTETGNLDYTRIAQDITARTIGKDRKEWLVHDDISPSDTPRCTQSIEVACEKYLALRKVEMPLRDQTLNAREKVTKSRNAVQNNRTTFGKNRDNFFIRLLQAMGLDRPRFWRRPTSAAVMQQAEETMTGAPTLTQSQSTIN